MNDTVGIHIEPWGTDDLDLVRKLMGDPSMTAHLGGPEPEEKMLDRQQRYAGLAASGQGRMFKIVDQATGEKVGSVGYWTKEWQGETVYETGWSVLPAFQGRGIAIEATRLAMEQARSDGKYRYVHAYPSVDNAPSNAICRRLGFELLGTMEFEYPTNSGHTMMCNDWRLDLEK